MKKITWVIASILLILGVLYSRSFFFTEPVPDTKMAPDVRQLETQAPLVSSPEEIKSESSAGTTFPPKAEPLVIPIFMWPPFYMKDNSGRWTGADTEIVETVLGRMGYRVELVEMPFARALEEMKSAKYPALMPCVVGGGREEFVLFSEPVSSIYSVLWKKRDDPFCWTDYDDLAGRVIGASHYHYGAGFFEAAEAGKFTLDMVAAKAPEVIHFRKLLQGKTDMFICELSVGLYLRDKHAPEFDQVDYCPTGVGPTRPFCLAVSRKYFEGREDQMHAFVDAFNRELTVFAGEGGRKEIFDRYHMLINVDDQGRVIVPGGKRRPE